jgi:hypothetical protein
MYMFSTHADTYRVVLVIARNPQLKSIDLAALEEIRGHGMFVGLNPGMCVLGNFGRRLKNSTRSFLERGSCSKFLFSSPIFKAKSCSLCLA